MLEEGISGLTLSRLHVDANKFQEGPLIGRDASGSGAAPRIGRSLNVLQELVTLYLVSWFYICTAAYLDSRDDRGTLLGWMPITVTFPAFGLSFSGFFLISFFKVRHYILERIARLMKQSFRQYRTPSRTWSFSEYLAVLKCVSVLYFSHVVWQKRGSWFLTCAVLIASVLSSAPVPMVLPSLRLVIHRVWQSGESDALEFPRYLECCISLVAQSNILRGRAGFRV